MVYFISSVHLLYHLNLRFFDSISYLDEQEERKIKNKDHSELYSVSIEIIEMIGIIPNEILFNNLVET